MMVSLIDLIVGGVMLIACYTDLSRNQIPNAITLPLWVLGIGWYLVQGLAGLGPWYTGLLGFAVAFPIHLFFWRVGLDRGGDAKLMIGFGACYGWLFMVEATLWSLLLMGPVSLILLALQGQMGAAWRATTYTFKVLWLKARRLAAPAPPTLTYVPKAPVLLMAWVLARFTAWLPTG